MGYSVPANNSNERAKPVVGQDDADGNGGRKRTEHVSLICVRITSTPVRAICAFPEMTTDVNSTFRV